MPPLYEYVCPNDHKEEFLEPAQSHLTDICVRCGGILSRITSVPSRAVISNGCTGAQRNASA